MSDIVFTYLSTINFIGASNTLCLYRYDLPKGLQDEAQSVSVNALTASGDTVNCIQWELAIQFPFFEIVLQTFQASLGSIAGLLVLSRLVRPQVARAYLDHDCCYTNIASLREYHREF